MPHTFHAHTAKRAPTNSTTNAENPRLPGWMAAVLACAALGLLLALPGAAAQPTAVTACGTLDGAGDYVLAGDLDGSAVPGDGACITISAAGVKLDGSQFSLTRNGGTGTAIRVVGADDVEISRVKIAGWQAALDIGTSQRTGISGSELAGAIVLTQSPGATIYNNRLAEGIAVQATDSAGIALSVDPVVMTNIAGGPSIGGNLWLGVACDDADDDGFCDTQHQHAEGLVDERPLRYYPRPDIGGTPAQLEWDNIPVGDRVTRTLTLKNEGDATLDITGVSLTGEGAGRFTIDSGGDAGALAEGATRDVVVAFAPDAAAGVVAQLDVASDDPDEPAFAVQLVGGGVAAKQLGAPVTEGAVRILSGKVPDVTPHLTAELQAGLVQVQLRAPGTLSYDLTTIGADSTTRVEISLTLAGFTPRVLLGAGHVESWSLTQSEEDASWRATIVLRPTDMESIDPAPEPGAWPAGAADQATTRFPATVQLAIDNLEGLTPDNEPAFTEAERVQLAGAVLATDAQEFSGLRYDVPEGGAPSLSLYVAAPHLTAAGGENEGFYDAILPQTLLDAWGITNLNALVAAFGDEGKTLTATAVEGGGARVEIPMHYSSGTVTVSKDSTAPVAQIAALAQPIEAGFPVALDGAASTDDVGVVSWTWDFGGGQTASGQTVERSFSPGTHTVTLRVADAAGNAHETTLEVVSQDTTAPVAVIAAVGPAIEAGVALTLDGAASTDNDVIASWTWDFGADQTTTGQTTQWTFSPGEHTITLRVADASGNQHQATLTLTASDTTAPTAVIEELADITFGATAAFDARASSDAVGIVSHAWDFGDGGSATSVTPTHQYAAPGEYTVRLTVSDAAGHSATATRVAKVVDKTNPVALIQPIPSAMAQVEVSFDGRGSADDVAVTSWSWDFGDGETGTGALVTHTYATEGDRVVKLAVSDAAGNTHESTLPISVSRATGVLARSVRIAEGTVTSALPYVESSLDQLLQIALRATEGGSYDLATIGADETTVFEIELTVKDYTPRLLLGAGKVSGWSVSANDDGSLKVVVTTRAVPVERIMDCEKYGEGCAPSMDAWPEGEADKATERLALAVQLAADSLPLEIEGAPVRTEAEREQLRGAIVNTDAQMFGSLEYRAPSDGVKPQVSLFVAGPHLTTAGVEHGGFYEAFLPQALLDAWGLKDASTLVAAYQGEGATLTAEPVEGGMRVSIPLHYSAGAVVVGIDATAPVAQIAGSTGGLVGATLSFDASGSTDNVGVSSWSWAFGDGATATGASVSHAYARAGTFIVTVTVTDAAGNLATQTREVVVASPPAPPAPAPPPPAPQPQPQPQPQPEPEPAPAPQPEPQEPAAPAPGVREASRASLDAAAARAGVDFAEPFRARDDSGDGKPDAFEDPSGTLAQVRPRSEFDGRAIFLVARAGETQPRFLWDATNDAVIDVDLPEPEVAETSYDAEEGRETVTVRVAKGEWIYFELPDPNPDAPLVEIRAADGRVMPPDRVWRENGVIAVLDDPDTVYHVVFDAPDVDAPDVVVASASVAGGELRVEVDARDARGVAEVSLHLAGERVASRAEAPYAFVVDIADAPPGDLPLRVVARDAAGNEAEATAMATVPAPVAEEPEDPAPLERTADAAAPEEVRESPGPAPLAGAVLAAAAAVVASRRRRSG